MRRRVAPFVENITESAAACLVTMVQGNLMAVSLSHWLIASRTGLIAGVVASVAILLARTDRRWLVSLVLGSATAIADYYVHPGQFGAIAMEAVVTGLVAGLLSYVVGLVFNRVKRRPRRVASR